MYETFDHTADLGIRVQAKSLEELFAEAGRGLFSVILGNLDDVACSESRDYRIAGREPDFLLFDWLSGLLFTFDTERLVFADFRIRIDREGLSASARGEKADPERHHLEREVKAITYHELRVVQTGEGWLAEFIVDI